MYHHTSLDAEPTKSLVQRVLYSLNVSHIQSKVFYFDRGHCIATSAGGTDLPHHEKYDRSRGKKKKKAVIPKRSNLKEITSSAIFLVLIHYPSITAVFFTLPARRAKTWVKSDQHLNTIKTKL